MSNRHERRKAAKTFELKMIPANELAGVVCAWRDCEATCKPSKDGDLPRGWSALLLTRGYRHYDYILSIPPSYCLRDAVLCPEHTRQLDSELLEDLGRELLGPPAGAA